MTMKISILVGLSFLFIFLPCEAQLAASSGCDASCLDETSTGQWPPEGFSEDEVAVIRCAVRCSQEMVEVKFPSLSKVQIKVRKLTTHFFPEGINID